MSGRNCSSRGVPDACVTAVANVLPDPAGPSAPLYPERCHRHGKSGSGSGGILRRGGPTRSCSSGDSRRRGAGSEERDDDPYRVADDQLGGGLRQEREAHRDRPGLARHLLAAVHPHRVERCRPLSGSVGCGRMRTATPSTCSSSSHSPTARWPPRPRSARRRLRRPGEADHRKPQGQDHRRQRPGHDAQMPADSRAAITLLPSPPRAPPPPSGTARVEAPEPTLPPPETSICVSSPTLSVGRPATVIVTSAPARRHDPRRPRPLHGGRHVARSAPDDEHPHLGDHAEDRAGHRAVERVDEDGPEPIPEEERELREDYPGDEDRPVNRPQSAQKVLQGVIESRLKLGTEWGTDGSGQGMVVPHSEFNSRADCLGLRRTTHAGTTPGGVRCRSEQRRVRQRGRRRPVPVVLQQSVLSETVDSSLSWRPVAVHSGTRIWVRSNRTALRLDASRGRPGGGRPAWQASAARLARRCRPGRTASRTRSPPRCAPRGADRAPPRETP